MNNQANFQNIPDGTAGAMIPANSTLPYTVKVDLSGLTGSASESISANIASSNLTVLNSSDSAVAVSGNAIGDTITVNQ